MQKIETSSVCWFTLKMPSIGMSELDQSQELDTSFPSEALEPSHAISQDAVSEAGVAPLWLISVPTSNKIFDFFKVSTSNYREILRNSRLEFQHLKMSGAHNSVLNTA